MNYQKLLIDNFIYKTSYVARHVQGMSVKKTKDYIAVNCGLPTDTFKYYYFIKQQLNGRKRGIMCGDRTL